jgi:hypothetical protein
MEHCRILSNYYIRGSNWRAASLKFRICITAGIHSLVFGYIDLVKSRDSNIELLTISTDNIWKLCGLELQYF